MATGHTRYPVVGGSADDLIGVVHLHDLLGATDPDATAASVSRQAVILPTTLPLPSALRTLNAARDEMALVIDEYGGFAGVLTMEDLAEELVGEIDDEHDGAGADGDIVVTPEGWLIRGDVALTRSVAPSVMICRRATTRRWPVCSSPNSAVCPLSATALPSTSASNPPN